MCVDRDGAVPGAIAEVFRHWRRIDDLSGVHTMIRIECSFHLPKRVVKLRTKEFFVQMTARQSVSVFSTHAAAELDNKVCDLIGHVFHDLNIACILCIDERPNMQTTDGC